MKLTEEEKNRIIELVQAGKTLPAFYKSKLFDYDDTEFIEATKDYRLVYKGKSRKEDIIAQTPAAPFQKIRSFCSDNSFEEDWQNMLIFGDNLLALKTLYEDQRGENKYKTKNKIKLIYIDPPFSTKQDFMKDREKAYRDKIIGAQFIEFLRKRLILMREILADDGSIYVHLDWKKGHYIKVIMDEIFGEHNFIREITFKCTPGHHLADYLDNMTANIFWYKKNDRIIFKPPYQGLTNKELEEKFPLIEKETGRRFTHEKLEKTSNAYSAGEKRVIQGKEIISNVGWIWTQDTFNKRLKENPYLIFWTREGRPRYKRYLDEYRGRKLGNLWIDLNLISSNSKEDLGYPTQKEESLLNRLIESSTNDNDIVLDAFAGSGTTMAVAEKLNRRWIGIDCGKLAIYTIQKRMLNLTTLIGSLKQDERRDYERVADFEEHSKANSRGLFLIYEKARKGDLVVTDSFLETLSTFISNNLAGYKREEFSLICPEEKFKLRELTPLEKDESKAGEMVVEVGNVRFLISFVQPKDKTEEEEPLQAKEFTLYHAGVYDSKAILDLDWDHYKPFVAQLFGVRQEKHRVKGFEADGYIGVHSAYIWDYPNQKSLVLDHEYIKTLHNVLGGKAGGRFYIIAPILSMGFMEDEIKIDDTTYVVLKVPLSVLKALIEKGDPGSLKQPVSETDVNDVIDAVGFDFISQPEVKIAWFRREPVDPNITNVGKSDWVIEISSFKSNTLVYDPDDFENFETLSMILVDVNYNEDYFNLSHVYWADDIVNEERDKAVVRIPEDEFCGDKMMVIFIDKYGNELKVVKNKEDFQ